MSSAPSLGNQTPSASTQLSASEGASLLDVHMMSRMLHVRPRDQHSTDLTFIGFSYLYYDSGDCQKGFKELGLFSQSTCSQNHQGQDHSAEALSSTELRAAAPAEPPAHIPDRAAGVGVGRFSDTKGSRGSGRIVQFIKKIKLDWISYFRLTIFVVLQLLR